MILTIICLLVLIISFCIFIKTNDNYEPEKYEYGYNYALMIPAFILMIISLIGIISSIIINAEIIIEWFKF